LYQASFSTFSIQGISPTVGLLNLSQHASRIYADPKVLNFARNLRMSEGQKVDFVLVYELPEFVS
jgi:hypothetical protein